MFKTNKMLVENMWLILKTFKLSGISPVHLFYLILIITPAYDATLTTAEDEDDPNYKQPEEKKTNIDDDVQEKPEPIQSNEDNSIVQGTEKTPEPANKNIGMENIIKRMSQLNRLNNIQSAASGDELSKTNPETENDKYGSDITKKDNEPDNDEKNPLNAIRLGLDSTEDLEQKKKEIEDANDDDNNKLKSAEKIPTLSTGDTQDDDKPIEKTSKTDNSDELKTDDETKSKTIGSTEDDAELKVTAIPEPGEKLTGGISKMTSMENGHEDNEELNEHKNTSTGDTQDDTEKNEKPPKSVTSVELETNYRAEMETNTVDSVKSETTKISDDMKNPTEDSLIDAEIDPAELTVSLENVEIVKIKPDVVNSTVEAKRKKKKIIKFREFTPSGNAHIYCTFLGDVLKMYNKVKKRFEGYLCHAVVIGVPIYIKKNRVHLSAKIKNQLKKIHPQLQKSLLIVIMQCSSYNDWSLALDNTNQLVKNVINTVVEYNIEGIQFSHLQPTGQDQIDIHMMDKITGFIDKLVTAALKKKRDLKIGITINSYSQSITTSFTSFQKLNPLVTWYSLQTISMLRCTPEFKSGTSPLTGEVSLRTSIETLKSTEIDTLKVIVGIQLYPNKVNVVQPFTYEELCSTPKNTWHKWCAAEPNDLHLKGLYLRKMNIGGVQLFYMHSDDYRSTCGCFSFPLIRALLRGLVKTEEPESCTLSKAGESNLMSTPLK